MSRMDMASKVKLVLGIMHGSRAFTGPFQASIELTNRCNIRCVHCYFYSPYVEKPNFFQVRRARQLSEDLPEKQDLKGLQDLDADSGVTTNLIDHLLRVGTRKFFFTGSGEPFLHRNTLDFIGRVKKACRACIVYTNGTLLDRRAIDELVAMGCNELKITTLAGSQKVYLRTHRNVNDGTFDKLRDNLLYLAQRKTETGRKYPEVSLHFVPISQNCDDIEQFVKFASSVRATRVLFRPLDTVGDPGLQKGIMLAHEQARDLEKNLGGIQVYLDARGIEHNIEYFLQAFREKMDTTELYRIIPCYYGWLGVRFDVSGHVYPCCRCYNPMGNIRNDDFREIWYGNDYRAFRNESYMINKRKNHVDGCECNSCTHFTANLMVFKALHPFNNYVSVFKRLSSIDEN